MEIGWREEDGQGSRKVQKRVENPDAYLCIRGSKEGAMALGIRGYKEENDLATSLFYPAARVHGISNIKITVQLFML